MPIVDWQQDRGRDIVLTIDRDVQYIAESELLDDINTYNATGGSIIVMNPRNGDCWRWRIIRPTTRTIMPASPTKSLTDAAIADQYEPGSIFKVLTMAAALEMGTITPDWGYNDTGLINVGGVPIYNWDRAAHGYTTATQASGRFAQRWHGDHQHENGSNRFLHDDGQVRHRASDWHRP